MSPPLQAVSYTQEYYLPQPGKLIRCSFKKKKKKRIVFPRGIMFNTYELAKNLTVSQKKHSEKLVTDQPQNFFAWSIQI